MLTYKLDFALNFYVLGVATLFLLVTDSEATRSFSDDKFIIKGQEFI